MEVPGESIVSGAGPESPTMLLESFLCDANAIIALRRNGQVPTEEQKVLKA